MPIFLRDGSATEETALRYGSVCSGIEAVTVALDPLGFEAAWYAEIDPFCCALLKHHYPEVPNLGDFTEIRDSEPIDLLVAGTPCQDFSVAGLRAGMDGARGQLTTEFLALAGRLRPGWLVWENVPGILSIDGGRAFGMFLGGLGKLGYGFAYRVLDAQHFGVPQRRRRVFVVGYLGDWRRAAAVLFERASLSGNPAPSREKREDVAGCLRDSSARGSDDADRLTFVPDIAHSLNARDFKGPNPAADVGTVVTHALRADGFDASEDGTGRRTPLVAGTIQAQYGKFNGSSDGTPPTLIPVAIRTAQTSANGHGIAEDVSHTLDGAQGQAVAYSLDVNKSANEGSSQGIQVEHSNALRTDKMPAVSNGSGVRRLTPEECESLQGFERGYTAVPYRGKPASDGPRYRALGNSMAVPVIVWLGRRILEVEKL